MSELKRPDITEEQAAELDNFYKVYQKLQKVIFQWQETQGQYWAKHLVPNMRYPYFSLPNLPEEPILELVKCLLEASDRVCSEEELRSAWNLYGQGQTLQDQELFSHFTLAVSAMFRWARLSLPENLRQKAESEVGPICPICGQEASLSALVPPVGKRVLHCLRCDHEWQSKRVGCIHCGSEDASMQTYLKNENFPGVEIVVCQACGGDFKEIDLRERRVKDWVWEDIRTLPLNYAAEKWLSQNLQH